MKLLLLSPCRTRTQRQFSYPSTLWHLASALGRQPKLGLEPVEGITVELAKVRCPSDYWAARHATQALDRYRPDVVGLGAYDLDLPVLSVLCAALHRHRPGLKIVIGGPFASMLPRTALAETGADILMRGEVDFTLREVMARLRDGRSPLGIDGVLTRDADGRVHDTPASERVPVIHSEQLELLELAPEFLERTYDRREYRYLPLVASRGCAFGCTFCTVNIVRNRRGVSDDKLLGLLRTYGRAYNVAIADPLFGGHRRGMLALLERKRVELPEVPLSANFAVDQLVEDGPRGTRRPNRATLELLVAAGVRQVELGIENFSDGVLERIKRRRYTGSEAAAVIEALAEAGLNQNVDLILNDFRSSTAELGECLTRLLAVTVRVGAARPARGPGLNYALNDKVMAFAGTSYYRDLLAAHTPEDWESGRLRARRTLDPEFPWFELDYELAAGPREFVARGGVGATKRLLQRIVADAPLARRLLEHGYGDDGPGGRAAWLAERLVTDEPERVLAGLDQLVEAQDSPATRECRRRGLEPLTLAAGV